MGMVCSRGNGSREVRRCLRARRNCTMEPPSNIAARLVERTQEIIRRWDERVRADGVRLSDQDRPTLADHLPSFLPALAQRLASAPAPNLDVEPSLSEEQRGRDVWPGEHSLDQVLQEYRVLRRVILEVLEA